MDVQNITSDYLIDLLERGKILGARQYWHVSTNVFRHLRTLKDGFGTCIYPASINAMTSGDLPPLLGLPVRVDKTATWVGIDLCVDLMAPTDSVEHPKHYTSHPSGIECIQITEHMGFNLGNAVKYIWRADLKHDDALEDLRKAKWYIEREIAKRGGGKP